MNLGIIGSIIVGIIVAIVAYETFKYGKWLFVWTWKHTVLKYQLWKLKQACFKEYGPVDGQKKFDESLRIISLGHACQKLADAVRK